MSFIPVLNVALINYFSILLIILFVFAFSIAFIITFIFPTNCSKLFSWAIVRKDIILYIFILVVCIDIDIWKCLHMPTYTFTQMYLCSYIHMNVSLICMKSTILTKYSMYRDLKLYIDIKNLIISFQMNIVYNARYILHCHFNSKTCNFSIIELSFLCLKSFGKWKDIFLFQY